MLGSPTKGLIEELTNVTDEIFNIYPEPWTGQGQSHRQEITHNQCLPVYYQEPGP